MKRIFLFSVPAELALDLREILCQAVHLRKEAVERDASEQNVVNLCNAVSLKTAFELDVARTYDLESVGV